VLELHGGSARSPVLGRDRDTNGCYANDDQLQAVTHIMTHRSEYFAGKTESSVAVNADSARLGDRLRADGARWRRRDGIPALYWTE
jgi:hypothetical protein